MKATGILVKDKKSGTITAYVKQLPGIVVQGDDVDGVKSKLHDAFQKFLAYNKGRIDDYEKIESTFIF